MGEPGQRAARRAVRKRELDLADGESRPRGVDRHADLHAEPRSERHHDGQDLAAQRPLARDRRVELEPRETTDRRARVTDREPEAAADTRLERAHGEVALAAPDR